MDIYGEPEPVVYGDLYLYNSNTTPEKERTDYINTFNILQIAHEQVIKAALTDGSHDFNYALHSRGFFGNRIAGPGYIKAAKNLKNQHESAVYWVRTNLDKLIEEAKTDMENEFFIRDLEKPVD